MGLTTEQKEEILDALRKVVIEGEKLEYMDDIGNWHPISSPLVSIHSRLTRDISLSGDDTSPPLRIKPDPIKSRLYTHMIIGRLWADATKNCSAMSTHYFDIQEDGTISKMVKL